MSILARPQGPNGPTAEPGVENVMLSLALVPSHPSGAPPKAKAEVDPATARVEERALPPPFQHAMR